MGDTVVAAVIEDNQARPIPGHRMIDLIRRANAEQTPIAQMAAQMAVKHAEPAELLIPISPPEVWACGCTYAPSADFRDAELGTREGMYAYVYREPRPEIFFKGTCRVCVGPGAPIGIRCDSRFTAPEPELALILGARGVVAGYTLANDVSAWDIERENALYLPQSKMYQGCCALGPVIVTTDQIGDPYRLEMTCSITRDGQEVFSGAVNTSRMNRKFETLLEYLLRANPVPAGSVLLTGTGIIVPETAALQPGDVVTIRVPELGELSNRAVVVE
jgi:2-dehydro-3-deoxy-D-arabinonate dehydratase